MGSFYLFILFYLFIGNLFVEVWFYNLIVFAKGESNYSSGFVLRSIG